MRKLLFCTLILILCNWFSLQLDDNQAKFTSTPFNQQAPDIDNIYILETAIDRFVVAVLISQQEQLLGILVNSSNPSWIFIDDGADQHKICFQGVRSAQLMVQKLAAQQQITKQTNQKQQDKQNYCIYSSSVKCNGNCQKINQLTQKEENSLQDIKGKYRYNVSLRSETKNIYKQFVSATSYIIKLSPISVQDEKQKSDDDYVIEEENFVRQQILNYYALITGQINIKDLEYVIVQHSIGLSRYFMLHQIGSFSKFTPSEIISIKSSENTKISIFYNKKQMHSLSIHPEFKFDEVTKVFSLPPTIINHLRYYIFKQLLKQDKCQEINHEVNVCTNDRHQLLSKQNFSICFSESQCLELNLGQVIDVNKQWSGQDSPELNYQYYLKIKPSQNQNVIAIYPEFATFYKILLKSGLIVGATKYKSQEQKNKSQVVERNISDHEHHEHIEQADKAKLNGSSSLYGKVAQQIIQTYQKVSSLEYFFKVIIIFTCCLTSLCCYFRGLPKLFGWGGKDDEQTQLMDRQIQMNEKIQNSEISLNSVSDKTNLNK